MTDHDLNLHLERFGKKDEKHRQSVKREHHYLEMFGSDYEIVRGRVVVPYDPNKVLAEFDAIIKDYVKFHSPKRKSA